MLLSKNSFLHYFRSKYPIFIFFLSLSLFFPFFFLQSQTKKYEGKIIGDIEFYGLENIKNTELKKLIDTKVGSKLSLSNLNRDIKILYKTGYFKQVTIGARLLPPSLQKDKKEKLLLIFQFEELAIVSSIKILGVKNLNSQELLSHITFQEGDRYNPIQIKKSAAAIKEKYLKDGYFLIEVWPRVSWQGASKKNSSKSKRALVYFFIDEGESIPISKINILGANRVKASEIVKILEQKEDESSSENSSFDETLYNSDKERIVEFAKSKGFLDASIDEEKTGYEIRWKEKNNLSAGRVVLITYSLLEGSTSYYAGYSIEHNISSLNRQLNPSFLTKDLKKEYKNKPIYKVDELLERLLFTVDRIGEVFSHLQFQQDNALIYNLYSSQGYAFMNTRQHYVDFKLNRETLAKYRTCLKKKTGDKCGKDAKYLKLDNLEKLLTKKKSLLNQKFRHVHFTIYENNLAYIEKIIITGNEKTKEHIIRRELLFKEGQLFNSRKINESRQRLINLQFFEEVNFQLRPASSNNKVNLVVEIEEKSTGMLSAGGGVGSLTGFTITAQISDSNFQGNGTRIGTNFSVGGLSQSVSVDYAEPWIYEKCTKYSNFYYRNIWHDLNESKDFNEMRKILSRLQEKDDDIRRRITALLKKTEKDLQKSTSVSLSIEEWDRLKSKMRSYLRDQVSKEEKCYRDTPRPWSLSFGISYNSVLINFNSQNSVPYIPNQYEERAIILSLGTTHRLSTFWSHYHSLSFSFIQYLNAVGSAHSNSNIEPYLGGLFGINRLRNSLIYSSIDNSFNPTRGLLQKFEIDIVGNFLGGTSHYNRYTISTVLYVSPFDFTFGRKNAKKELKRYRFVQEFTFTARYTERTKPVYAEQDLPYLSSAFQDSLYLGGTGTGSSASRLRGYVSTGADRLAGLPNPWLDGGHHLIAFGTEFRIPIDPRFAWLVVFLDAGILLDEPNYYTGLQRSQYSTSTPECSANLQDYPIPGVCAEKWHDPNRYTLKSIKLDSFLFSWGIGIRIQVPQFPIRLYFSRRLYRDGFFLKEVNQDWTFEFALGDARF